MPGKPRGYVGQAGRLRGQAVLEEGAGVRAFREHVLQSLRDEL